MLNKTFRFPRFVYSIAAIIGIVFIAGLISGNGINNLRLWFYPVAGIDSLDTPGVFEDHREALSYWIDQGVSNAVLVNIDAHDDAKRIPQKKIEALRTISPEFDAVGKFSWRNEISARVANGNFIYAAGKMGVVREVFWILPFPFFNSPDQEDELIQLLKYHNFPDHDIRTFRKVQGHDIYKGHIDGIPVNVCTFESLPTLNEPVLLSIDVDYAPVMADGYQEKIIDTVRRSLGALFEKKYRVNSAVISYSVNGGHLKTMNRWVGDLIIDCLKSPDMILAPDKIPGRYYLLDRSESLMLMGRHNELLEHLLSFTEQSNSDPAVLMYVAQALKGIGAINHSYDYAEKACIADRNYCYGLCEIGCCLLREQGLDVAESFFTRGYELNPGMAHSQFQIARAMKDAGRYAEAVNYFEKFREHYGSFPADFYLGEIYIHMGDEEKALGCFNRGGRALLDDPYVWGGFGDEEIVRQAIGYYETKGHIHSANELRMSIEMKEDNFSTGSEIMKYCADCGSNSCSCGAVRHPVYVLRRD